MPKQKKLTITQLRNFEKHVKELLGDYWNVVVYSQEECKSTYAFDPPCAYVEVKLRNQVVFLVDPDGFWHDGLEKYGVCRALATGADRYRNTVLTWIAFLKGEVV